MMTNYSRLLHGIQPKLAMKVSKSYLELGAWQGQLGMTKEIQMMQADPSVRSTLE